MKITLDIFKHHGLNQIGIRFPYNFELKEYVKKFDGVRWSATYTCFYVPFSLLTYKKLLTHLNNPDWTINKSNVDKFVTHENANNIYLEKYEKIVDIFGNWMAQKRYANSTISTYVSVIKIFFRHYSNKNFDEITEKDIIRFNQDYILANGFSATFQNQFISAIKLFYQKYQNKHLDLERIERPKKSKKLPQVLSIEEVEELLNATFNLKHKVLLSIIYSAGLRIGEALNLTLADIDSQRMLINVRNAKGKKDRYVPLSRALLPFLREYYTEYKPQRYLFEGRQKGEKYSQVSSRQVFNRLVEKCGIRKSVSLHTLRHSYATHLLETGTDIRYIQELLGHNSPKTTMIYTHVSSQKLQHIKSPFDKLSLKEK